MITMKNPEIPSKKYFNPEKLVKDYEYTSNNLPSEFIKNIAHNIALLLNRPIEDFVRYYSLEEDDERDRNNYKWYERQHWLFYVDIDADTRYFFIPATVEKDSKKLFPYLLIRKKVNNTYEHIVIFFSRICLYKSYIISRLYDKVNKSFRKQDEVKVNDETRKKSEKFCKKFFTTGTL